MPEIPNLTRKPLVKKEEEMDITPKSTFKVDTVVEDISVVEAPVVKKAIVPSGPKQYRCKTRCWVSSKCQMFEAGDITTFVPGEFVPEHFE
jgi:hypothetical protein